MRSVQEAKSLTERAADEALRILREPPPLALVAVIAALIELVLARACWQALPDLIDADALRGLRDVARFPRNLAAVSGIVALVFAILSFLRLPGFAPIGRRLAVAAFSGIFVPGVVVATMFPYASLRRRLVIFGLAAANVLVTLLAMTALRNRPHGGVRIASGLVAATAFLSLILVGLGQIAYSEVGAPFEWLSAILSANPTTTQRALLGLRNVGEVCWMGMLAATAFTILHRRDEGRNTRYGVAAVAFVIAVAAVIATGELVGHRFRLVLFGSFRVGLFLDVMPSAYALPIGLAIASGVVGLAQRDGATRQLAGAVLLWLAAGYAPHTPIQLLYLVLSAVMLTRAAQALDPDGEWRERNPWLRLAPSG